MDVSREIDVSGDRLKREIPSPKDRVEPLFWTAKHLSDRVIEGESTNSRGLLKQDVTQRANGNFCVSGGALIPVTTTGNQPNLLSMGTPRGSSTSSRSTPKLEYSGQIVCRNQTDKWRATENDLW